MKTIMAAYVSSHAAGISPTKPIYPSSRFRLCVAAESMAGKAGALHGCFQESTPFRFGDAANGRSAPGDHFGQQVR